MYASMNRDTDTDTHTHTTTTIKQREREREREKKKDQNTNKLFNSFHKQLHSTTLHMPPSSPSQISPGRRFASDIKVSPLTRQGRSLLTGETVLPDVFHTVT